MITVAPLPAWGDLLALLKTSVPADGALAAPWVSGADRAYLLSRSAWALAVLIQMRKDEGEARPRLWLPDFFCNQSSGPARAAGADIVFYPVDAALAPEWAACRALAERARPSLFVLVHYFGRANDAEGARAFCGETGAALVEDAAHALKPCAGIGASGDFVLYSPHKLLGIPDGAVLVARAADAALVRTMTALPVAQPCARTWVLKRALQKAVPEAAWKMLRPIPDIPFERDPPPAPLPPAPSMSASARKMLARAIPRLEAEATSRRAAEKILRQVLAGVSGWSPWPAAWGADETPYRAVFVAETAALAAERFARLHRAGCLVESWPDLAPEVTADPERHRAAIDLRRRLLVLPLPAGTRAIPHIGRCLDAVN